MVSNANIACCGRRNAVVHQDHGGAALACGEESVRVWGLREVKALGAGEVAGVGGGCVHC